MVQLSHPYMITRNTIALTTWTFVGKVMSICSISPTNVLLNPTVKRGLPRWYSGKRIHLPMQEMGFESQVRNIPWRMK